MNSLHHLRESISSIDRAVIDLLAARMSLARSIGSVKSHTGMPVYDPAREVEVITLVRRYAERAGLNPDLAAELYSIILRYSRCLQVTCNERVRILIYGYGSMAKTLASHMARAGCWVVLTGRDEKKAERVALECGARYEHEEDAVEWADWVIYAVPTDVVPQLLQKHLRLMRESQLVSDISSVKKPLVSRVRSLLPREGPEYASLHPLFGPLECPAGETVAIIPVRLEAWRERLQRVLEGLGFRVEFVDEETHDKVMAVNQVLHHLVLELFSRARSVLRDRLGVSEAMLKLLTTYSLRQTLRVVERIEALGKVVEEIRKLNPYTDTVVDTARSVLDELAANLKNLGSEAE